MPTAYTVATILYNGNNCHFKMSIKTSKTKQSSRKDDNIQ